MQTLSRGLELFHRGGAFISRQILTCAPPGHAKAAQRPFRYFPTASCGFSDYLAHAFDLLCALCQAPFAVRHIRDPGKPFDPDMIGRLIWIRSQWLPSRVQSLEKYAINDLP